MSKRDWKMGEFDEYLGYDCMTSGIRCGPAILDGSDYGQERSEPISDQAKEQMIADARLIAAAPDLLEALQVVRDYVVTMKGMGHEYQIAMDAAIKKATE